VPLRGTRDAREVLLVHRPAYDDWTLPKGKAHPHELLPTTAVREVAEESSVTVRLATGLTPVRYPIGATIKIVSWWVGATVSAPRHAPNAEVDDVAWMSPEDALATLSYADERGVLTEAVSLPDTTPLIIIRHAKALRREAWRKDDRLRPLSEKGHEQLSYVAQILKPFGITHFISSTSTRCVQTLRDYANQIGSDIHTETCLSEEKSTPAEVGGYMARLAHAVGASGIPTVVCGHSPVLPAMMAPLGIPARPMATASCMIAHVDTNGAVVASEWHDTLRVKI